MRLLSRFLALFLTLAVGLPSPALGLRPAGLEESYLVKAAVTKALTKGRGSVAGLKDVREYKPPAIPVTIPGLKEAGFKYPTAEANFLQFELNRLDPHGKKKSVSLGGVTFFRARHGTKPVWAFHRKDKSKVKKINPQRRFAGSRYVTVSITGLKAAGFVNVVATTRQLKAKLTRLAPKAAELEVLLNGVLFHKIIKPGGPLWTFERTQTKQVKAFTKNYPFLRRGEVRVRGESLEKEGFTTPHRAAKELIERLDALDPKGDLLEVELAGVTFFRRYYKGRRSCWAFKRRDLARVRRFIRNPFRFVPELHVAVSADGLKSAGFTGWQAAADKLKALLAKLDPNGEEIEVRLGGVRFFRVAREGKPVWAFDQKDIPAVAMLAEASLGAQMEAWIEKLQLADVVALLGSDPLRLAQYLHIYHPELSPQRVDQVAVASLRGLQGEWAEEVEGLHRNYAENLEAPSLGEHPSSTEGHSFLLSGRVTPGVPQIQVIGAYTRQVRVRKDGTFSATLPLPRVGELNEFHVYALNPDKQAKSPAVTLRILQSGKREDIEETFLKLLDLRQETEQEIQKVPGRYQFTLRAVELALLKRFTYDEQAGLQHVKDEMEQAQSPAMKAILREVLNKFTEIAGMKFDVKPDKKGKPQRLYFFQKYTIWEVHRMLEQGARGVIIGSQQGLGKTVTTLALLNGQKAVIIAPNALVTTWAEQEGKFFAQPNLEVLEGSHRERDKALEALDRPQVVTNVEFLRSVTPRRARQLSRPDGFLVIDEASYLNSSSSLQSRGTHRLTAGRKILLTAAPFKKPWQIRNLLAFLYPDNPVYRSARAFARAYPSSDPATDRALFLLLQRHMIRIRQQDVFERFDPKVPLEEQSDRLPVRVRIPSEKLGQFYLTQQQCKSILELFTRYRRWCEKHKKSGEVTDEDRRYWRYSEGYFSRKEALCQTMNDPAYIGRPEIESPKHLVMDRIVEKELAKDPSRKILIFVKYKAQVREYLKRYKRYGARAYYGDLPANSNGYRVDDKKQLLYYLVDEYRNFMLDDQGRPIPSDKESGRPIRALDYEWLLFQNNPESRVMIATDKTGGVGVTLAAGVVVRDQPADTFQDEAQALNRAGRIDNDRKMHTVTEYLLQALYPKSFLKKLPPRVRRRFFGNGTYDQIQTLNLARQGKIFHRIMDGVGSEAEMETIHESFMKKMMPNLFVNGETAPATGLEESARQMKELYRLGT